MHHSIICKKSSAARLIKKSTKLALLWQRNLQFAKFALYFICGLFSRERTTVVADEAQERKYYRSCSCKTSKSKSTSDAVKVDKSSQSHAAADKQQQQQQEIEEQCHRHYQSGDNKRPDNEITSSSERELVRTAVGYHAHLSSHYRFSLPKIAHHKILFLLFIFVILLNAMAFAGATTNNIFSDNDNVSVSDQLLPFRSSNYEQSLAAYNPQQEQRQHWQQLAALRQRRRSHSLDVSRQSFEVLLATKNARDVEQRCGAEHFSKSAPATPTAQNEKNQRMLTNTVVNNTFYIYAVTEDCQVFFARVDQLAQIARSIKVDHRFTHCRPDLVQLHWHARAEEAESAQEEDGERRHDHQQQLSLRLLVKREPGQICTLPVELPPETSGALVGADVFSYSLRASLNYAVCSVVPNSTFHLEPTLSFMDALYSDIVYFIDPTSFGDFWTVRQFKFDAHGYLRFLDTFEVKNIAENNENNNENNDGNNNNENATASEYVVALDAERRRLFVVDRRSRGGRHTAYSTCPYNLLFRPHRVRVNSAHLTSANFAPAANVNINKARLRRAKWEARLNAITVDGVVMMLAEQRPTRLVGLDAFSTRIYFAKQKHGAKAKSTSTAPTLAAKCAAELPFRATLRLISAQSLRRLRAEPRHNFDAAKGVNPAASLDGSAAASGGAEQSADAEDADAAEGALADNGRGAPTTAQPQSRSSASLRTRHQNAPDAKPPTKNGGGKSAANRISVGFLSCILMHVARHFLKVLAFL